MICAVTMDCGPETWSIVTPRATCAERRMSKSDIEHLSLVQKPDRQKPEFGATRYTKFHIFGTFIPKLLELRV